MDTTARVSELPPVTSERGHSSFRDYTKVELVLPRHLERQLVCLAEISYPFESSGLLIGYAAGRRHLVEQVTYVDPSGDRSGHRRIPGPEILREADQSVGRSGLQVIGVWHSLPGCAPVSENVPLRDLAEENSYLTVSVPVLGAARFRSWRRSGGLLLEEFLP